MKLIRKLSVFSPAPAVTQVPFGKAKVMHWIMLLFGILFLAKTASEDENGQVTKNWTGIIPAEGPGFSNGQRISISGPPTYEKSKLTKSEYSDGIKITVQYP